MNNFYKNQLVSKNGKELTFTAEGREMFIHFYKTSDLFDPPVIDDSSIYIRCLVQPNEREDECDDLSIYGTIVLERSSINEIVSTLKNVRNDLINGKIFVRDRSTDEIINSDRDWLNYGLKAYGGSTVMTKSSKTNFPDDIPREYDLLYHIHQWLDRRNSITEYNILINGFSKPSHSPDEKYDSDDYSSILIGLNSVDSFIQYLESFQKEINESND